MPRRAGSPRRIALAAALAGALAATSAGCGRDGPLVQTRAGIPPPTATTQAEPTTATTPPTRTPTTTSTIASGRAGPAVSDWRLRTIAAAFARRDFEVQTRADQATVRRSRSNPRWAVVFGAGGRTLWAVWLRDGAVTLAARDEARLHQPSVPCDVRLPLSARRC